jgi:hypothetical protein
MTIELGRIHDVRITYLGGHLAADAAAGATVLTMEDSLDFNQYGGTISLNGVQYGYSSTDYDLEQVTLTTGLVAPAAAGDRVDVLPLSVQKVAAVVINDTDDAVTVRVPHALADKIPEGIREPGERESVEIIYEGTEFVIRDVLGKSAVIGDATIDPVTLPPAALTSVVVDLNASTLTIGGGLIVLDTINIGVAAGDAVNVVYGLELDGTGTGTGTVTVTFYYGSTPVGPTVQVPFTAGPVHIAVADAMVGLTTSDAFTARAQVTSGTGTLTIPANAAHLYVLGAGLVGGGTSTAPVVEIAETVTYGSDVTDAGATPSLLGPLTVGPTESVDTTPATVTETVTVVTTP